MRERDEQLEEQVERALRLLRDRFDVRVPLASDRELAADLTAEARPAAHALGVAVAIAGSAAASSREHHEALALLSLLGRRAADLEATPTAASLLVPALLEGLREVGVQVSAALDETLIAVCLEGYVAAREERVRQTLGERYLEAIPILSISERCALVVLSGPLEAERIEALVERLGRRMLSTDARACLVDLQGLLDPTPQRAAVVFGADATARMLGATCVFSGVSQAWLDAAEEADLEVSLLCVEPTFAAGLARALDACGLALRRGSWIPGPLRRMVQRRE